MCEKSQMRINAERNPEYSPYCLRCTHLIRMMKVEPFLWKCSCGAIHDERQLNEKKQEMERLAEVIRNGPINITAYYIWKYIQRGEVNAARMEYQNDGDKLKHIFLEPISQLLGCRLHLQVNCDHRFCKER